MALSTLAWRPVNYFRSIDVRAKNLHTSNWGLGRIWKKAPSLAKIRDEIIDNVNARALLGTLSARAALNLPMAILESPKTSWRVIALALSRLSTENYFILDEDKSFVEVPDYGGKDPCYCSPEGYTTEHVGDFYKMIKGYHEDHFALALRLISAQREHQEEILVELEKTNPDLHKGVLARFKG